MYNLFAYTKDPSRRIVRLILDGDVQKRLTEYLEKQVDLFNDGCEEIDFDGKYKPDEKERLVISSFDDIDNLAKAVAFPAQYPDAQEDETLLESIKAIFFGAQEHGSWCVYLQAFDRRRLITNSGFSIFHSGSVYKKLEGTGITLDTKVSAKLVGNRLSFRSFFYARQMFDLTSYYQEATDSDIEEFSNIQSVEINDVDLLVSISDSWVRRKLWLIRESKILEKVLPSDLKMIAAGFNVAVDFKTNDAGIEVLVVPDEKRSLKTLLRFLDEDYYTSPLSKTNFMTNSKVALKQEKP